MHPFKKLCKHAEFEIGNKHNYSKKEYDAAGGCCWKCNKPLMLDARKPYASIEDVINTVSMDDACKESLKDEKEAADFLEWMNQPRWECIPCFKALLEERRKGPFIPI